jgi:hypothetical protein
MGLFSIKLFSSNVYQPTRLVFWGVFWLFLLLLLFSDLKTSLNNFIPVHLTVISPHHRRLCFYFWTFVCSNCDIFHLLGTDKVQTVFIRQKLAARDTNEFRKGECYALKNNFSIYCIRFKHKIKKKTIKNKVKVTPNF